MQKGEKENDENNYYINRAGNYRYNARSGGSDRCHGIHGRTTRQGTPKNVRRTSETCQKSFMEISRNLWYSVMQ